MHAVFLPDWLETPVLPAFLLFWGTPFREHE
jgi:hypothetical protein